MCEADNWTHDRADQAWKTNRKATNNPEWQHVEGTRASTWRRLFALRFLLVSPSSALCLVLFFWSDDMRCRLVYFDAMGKAEVIRMILAFKNVDFEDERLTFDEWNCLKPGWWILIWNFNMFEVFLGFIMFRSC